MPSVSDRSATVSALLRQYLPDSGNFDELTDAQGGIRPHWRRFLDRLGALGSDELGHRWDQAQTLLHENGVSYNVYGDSKGVERPWRLSPVPLVLSPDDWALLVPGLVQRAHLLEEIIADLYGPQRFLAEGWLPAELVFAHPGFLRACQGVQVGRSLPLYAADLVRDKDGSFLVLADRTQAPSGAGYALENRIIVARTLPDVFRDCNVERLARFFRAMRDTLVNLAPRNRDNPRVVLLTPGPSETTYFEQAYLSQYLGYPLVHGGDLTVREGRVFLKTLGGLQPVDVIFRRVADDACDPLELRPDSLLGIPGLVQAVRDRSVAVVNPLGTGVAQTAALIPFLGNLCRQLLGEDLLIPSVGTYWCGDPEGRAQVLDRLAELVIKPTFARGYTEPLFGQRLSSGELAALRARITARPRDFVAQEQVSLSTTPILEEDHLEPRHLVLRTFLVASGDSHMVMPGALCRFATEPTGLEVSMQRGGGSKDTWVTSGAPVNTFSLLPPASQPVLLNRGGTDLPSRSADNLFWLGRYAERAEGIARLARVIVARLTEQGGQPEVGTEILILGRVLGLLTHSRHREAGVGVPGGPDPTPAAWEKHLFAMVFDDKRPGSLLSIIRATHEVARETRDRISLDTWRVLNSLDQDLGEPAEVVSGAAASTLGTLNQVVLTLAALSGLAMDSMTRGHAWRFLDLGRRLERASSLVTILQGGLVERGDREGALLEAVLETADSAMTYRRRYLTSLQAAPVIDLLLTDETNPRSVAFQMATLAEHVEQLPRDPTVATRSPQQRIVLEALTELRLADVDALCGVDSEGQRRGLAGLLGRLGKHLPALSDSLSANYLNHATVSRQLSGALEEAS